MVVVMMMMERMLLLRMRMAIRVREMIRMSSRGRALSVGMRLPPLFVLYLEMIMTLLVMRFLIVMMGSVVRRLLCED